jgi:23S rRNA pseudouridine1911/1915/1917 synthase
MEDLNIFEFCAEESELGERLDKILAARLPDLSRTRIQELIKAGEVHVGVDKSKPAYRLEHGDCVNVALPPLKENTPVQPENIPLQVLYEDEHLAVVNKHAGMVVHPAHGNEHGTLVNAVLHHWPQTATVGDDDTRAGIVHRLDKETSGVILIALTDPARENLMAQFKDRTIEKHYLALTERQPPNDRGKIDAPIGRDAKNRKRMAVVRDGRESVTEFQIRERYSGDYALLDVHPITGRTHQIRVHLAFIECPIVGDTVYGYRKQRQKALFLHAYRISFDHPYTGERMTFEAPLPNRLQNILDSLQTS